MVDYRKQRVEDEIKRILSELFIKDFDNPSGSLITVSRVICSTDFRQAKIYLSVFNLDEQVSDKTFQKIKKQNHYIRGLLGHRIQLKYVPELVFFNDDSFEHAERIERLIQSLHSPKKNE